MTEITIGVLAVTAVVAILSTILLIVVMLLPRTLSSRSRDNNRPLIVPIPNTSSAAAASSLSSKTWRYDVFLSFRGEDTRKNFVDHLYSALKQNGGIRAYKDDVTLPRGDSIGPSLMNAIQDSQIAVVIFSENYADSSWCLQELEHIMKCRYEIGQIVLPVFYNVDPSQVRKQKGKYEKAFSKHESSENNITKQKIESWRKALFDASNIAGWEPRLVANGHEAECIKEIVGSILDKLSSLDSVVHDENLVGMGTRLQDLKSRLRIGSGGVRMVGIWGVGGGGKTTLATSLYMEIISGTFDICCFVENIRMESSQHNGLKDLQRKLLSSAFCEQSVPNVDIGKHMIKKMLRYRNVLIVLDDVDDQEQLEALAGSHDWFGDGSRVIITTRDEHVLISHGVDVISPINLLSSDEAIRLFRRYAYHKNKPVEDYDKLSLSVINYANGLPLALKILGSFLYGKNKNEWISALDKLKCLPNRKVTDQLKISYDGLDREEKELFLDVACFFRRCWQDDIMDKLDACGFHSTIGLTVLRQKALLTISSHGFIDMHDLVQEMGHEIVRGEHPNNPENHSRVWKTNEIAIMFMGNPTMENNKIEAIDYVGDCSPGFTKLVSNMKKLRYLDVKLDSDWYHEELESNYDEGPAFLSHELKYISWVSWNSTSPFPESFKPTKLVVLKLCFTLQKELWKGCKYLPCLKELEVIGARHLVRTPDFGGLPCLEKLALHDCGSLKDIDPSLGNHSRLAYISVKNCEQISRFPIIVWMGKLERLLIYRCDELCEFQGIEANMDSLIKLSLKDVGIQVLPSSVGRYCTNLISLHLESSELRCIDGNFRALKHLKKFKLNVDANKLEKFPKDLFDEECCLEVLRLVFFNYSKSLPSPPHLPRYIRKLSLRLNEKEVPSGISELSDMEELDLSESFFSRLSFSLLEFTHLKLLNLSDCENLVELPELPSNLCILKADDCDSLSAIRDDVHRNCKSLCQVSITKSYGLCDSFVGGEGLLETMLQGKAQCISVWLKGLEISKGFKPCLVEGTRYRLKLPENSFNEFSGLLLCYVTNDECNMQDYVKISMRQEEQKLQMGMGDSQNEQVFWEEEEGVDSFHTWIGYVSFGSFNAWSDKTSSVVDISIHQPSYIDDGSFTSGFGVKLVSKKDQMEETTETSMNSSADDDYKCRFEILKGFNPLTQSFAGLTALADSSSLFEYQFRTISRGGFSSFLLQGL
uniref:TMV resistance protein N-like n=1 Tax=Erigeron canadensis TaxID=72917 RepID=UPI001CB9A2F8|nr:TMV resistance protein N-like [Erigeron canadensis]